MVYSLLLCMSHNFHCFLAALGLVLEPLHQPYLYFYLFFACLVIFDWMPGIVILVLVILYSYKY